MVDSRVLLSIWALTIVTATQAAGAITMPDANPVSAGCDKDLNVSSGEPVFTKDELLRVLVETASTPHSERHRWARSGYVKLTNRTETQVDEDISMAVLMGQPDEGASAAGTEHEAEEAFRFIREHTLVLPAALMEAITLENLALVRGLLTIAQRGEEVCQNVPGFRRYCKDLDLNAGWKNKSFLLSAAAVSEEIAFALIQAGADEKLSELIKLNKSTSVDATIKKMLSLGAKADVQDLKQLIVYGRTDLVIEVLKHFPQLATENAGEDRTPLFLAIRAGNVDVVDHLLSLGTIDVNARVANKHSALFEAVKLDDPAIFEKLLDAGADVHQTDAVGRTLIHAALLKPNCVAMKTYISELILAGVDVNQKTYGAFNVDESGAFNRVLSLSANLTAVDLSTKLRDAAFTNFGPTYKAMEALLAKNGGK